MGDAGAYSLYSRQYHNLLTLLGQAVQKQVF